VPPSVRHALAILVWPLQRLSGSLNSIKSDAGAFTAFTTMLGTIAQVAGVFLGLYFATLSLLASSSYRDVPADLRAIVVEERAGSVYLKLVAFTCAVALCMLGLSSIGLHAGALSAVAVTILSVVSTLSFLPLGIRAFSFFDPGSLAVHLTERVERAALDATPRGYLWDDRSFQSHSQREAAHAMDILRSLVDVTAGTAHSARSMLTIGRRSLSTLRQYSRTKADIPPTTLV
jgi:hypothetical protein